MLFREIAIKDADQFTQLTQQVDESAEFMLWEAGERNIKPEQQVKMIENFHRDENSIILVAEDDHNQLVGYLMAVGGNAKRNQHTVYIVVGILEDFRGKGIGTKLFHELDRWALTHQIHRIELTVVTKNEAGLSLYKKMGFEVEGTKRRSLFIDGEFLDEYYMSKLLP